MSPLPFSCTLWSRQRKLNLSRSTVWCVAADRLNTGPNICLDIERSVAPRKRDRFISSNLCLCKCHLNTLKWLISLQNRISCKKIHNLNFVKMKFLKKCQFIARLPTKENIFLILTIKKNHKTFNFLNLKKKLTNWQMGFFENLYTEKGFFSI